MLIAYLQQATHSVNTFVPWLKYLQVHLIFHCLLEFQDVIYAQRKIGKKAEELGNESTKLDKFLERFVMVVFWPDQGVL